MQDNEIIDLYLKRDEGAIDATSEKYGAYCTKIAMNILNDSFDAEECVNDTYMHTWNSIPPTIPRVLSGFLAKITRNLAIDRYRNNKAKRVYKCESSIDDLSFVLGGNSIADNIEISEIGNCISRFLHTEGVKSRKIFIRKYFFEDSISEIAKENDMSEGAVKTSLFRTRKRLAEFLKKEGIYI